MKSSFRRILLYLAYCIARPIVQLYHLTCRIEHQGPLLEYLKNGKPFLMAWWHQDMLFNYSFLTRFTREQKMATMASRSQDGDLAAYLLNKHNYEVVRGSSSRGGSTALKELVTHVQKKKAIGIIVCDGPRPPARVSKFGIVALARETDLPIIMVRSWAKHQFIFWNSWPKLVLVYPFSKVVMLSDGPVHVPKETTRGEIERYRLLVEKGLNRLAEASERHFV
jgi:lysophospholipid acyltransferase (LPLAT)-like uncharacterized protein